MDSIPDNYDLWRGKWKSTFHPKSMVNGEIELILKKNKKIKKPEDSNYKTWAYITYKGSYRKGGRYKLIVEVNHQDRSYSDKEYGTSFKAYFPNSEQYIKYYIDRANLNEVEGIYKSYNPTDKGKIHVYRTSEKLVSTQLTQGKCIIS